MKRSIKSLLTLALAAFTGWMWAAELVIPYTFDGKAGNTDIPYEYKVQMPNTALTSFTTTISYAGGDHRVEILSVKLLDGETTYTAVATGTEGAAAGTQSGSYSGGNSYNNVYTFTNEAGFTANKAYTLQAMLKVTEGTPSHNGNIKISGGITLYAMPYAFGVNFTKDDSNVTTDATLGYTTEGYAAPAAWTNVAGASGGYTSIAAPNAMSYTLTWSANGGWNSGNAKDADAKNLLYGYLDDVAANSRKKASVTITGLPADRKYAVAVILSGDGADGKDAFNNVYSPVLINGQTYSYDANGNLLTGEAAMAETTWGDRRASASTDGTLTIGKNVMFVEDLSGSELTITSALDAIQVSRLTIAGIQVWISEETVTPTASAPALPEGAEVISINFDDSNNNRKVTGSAGIYTVDGWNNISGASGSASSLTVSDGTTQVPQAIGFSFSSNNSYRWDTATDVFLKGYLDDGGNRAQVTLNNIPFKKYSVIVYTATDSGTNYRFATVQINNKVYIGTPYATSIGYAAEVEGMGAIWGQACQKTAAYGVNALRVDGLSGDLSIQGGSNANNARGGIAAIQIVNTGASIFSDVQEIDWTEQAAENMKVSALPEITKAVVELTLPAGATLIVDKLPTVALNILSDGAVTLNVTDLSISQAQLNAMFNAAGVTGGITDNYTETLGYTKDGETYPLIFRGTTDANWATLTNWYIGTRTNGTETYWIPYTGTTVPGAEGSNEWRATLVDGDLMSTAAGEDGYKTVTLSEAKKYEGWAIKIAAYNKAHVVIGKAKKYQSNAESGPGFLRVDDTSKITFQTYENGNGDGDKSIYVNAPDGVVFAEGTTSGIKNMTYYFDGDGSVVFATLNQAQTIAGLELDLGTADEGRKIVSRKLIGFTGGNATFTVAENAVTTTAEDVTLETADILQNVGQYKFVKKDDGYYVSYVAYAATDEIGAMNTWTATVDGNWNTAGNWSSGFVPAAGKNATISITDNTTITLPEGGVTVDNLTVNGDGTLTIAGGKLTATKIFANANIAAGETTLALAPMNIAEGKTVTYTIDTNGEQKVPALTGAGTFAKAGTGMLTMDKDSACDASITVNAGTLRFHEYAYGKTYNIVAKDGAKIQVGTWAGSLTSTSNVLKLEGGAMLQLNNGNVSTGAVVKGTIVIDSTAEKPAVIKGNNNGNNGIIAATIKGNGVLEIQDADDNFFTISGVIANGDTEGDVLAVKVVTDRGVTFTGANTYTGGTIVVDGGVLKVQKMSALGAANTEVNIAKGGKVTVTSTGNVTEDSGVARAVFAGEGTVEFNGAGYYVLPNNFKAPAYLINNQADNLTISTDGTYDVGSYSGEKYFRMDYNEKGDRALVITQRADATIASDIVQMFGSINNDQRLTDVTVKGVDGATLTLSGAHDNVHFRTLTIDATGSVNLAGGWKGNIVANGKLAGEGTIGGTLSLADGATLAGAVKVTGDVTVEGALTITHAKNAGDTVITCANAEAVAAVLTGAPEGLRYVAENGAVKLAVAKVTVTLPAVENAVWKDANGNTITSVTIDPNSSASVKLETTGDYVFADGSTSMDVTIESGDADSEATAPADASIVAAGAKIGDKLYTSFAAAFAAAKADDTITLLAGVTINSRLDIAQNVTIDLNGQTIAETIEDQFGAIYVKKGATLTIEATKGGEITTDGGIVIGNYGTVIVNGGTIAAGEEPEADVSIYNFYYQADWYGTTIINGGTVARIWNCGVATLAGGEVTDVDNSGAMTIDGSTVTNVLLRDGTDAPGIEGAGTLKAAADLTVTTEEGYKAVYDAETGTWTAIDPSIGKAAKIGDEYYTTLDAALEDAAGGDTITLLADITASEIITIEKAITLDGNGKTLTSTAGRAINVDCAGAVTIKNLTVTTTGERGINVINKACTLTLTAVDVTAYNYTVNVAASAAEANVTITDSALTGKNVVNVAASDAIITIDGTTLTCVDESTSEYYATLFLNKDAKGATITATNMTFNLSGDSKKASNQAENGTITIDGSTNEVSIHVATLVRGEYWYGSETVAALNKTAQSGETITLIRDMTSAETVQLKSGVTLDLNGYTSKGTILGTIAVNGGTYVTAEDQAVIGKNARTFESTDAVFTMDAVAGNISLDEGTVTAKDQDGYGNNWTLPGQTLTIKSGVSLTIPAGVTMQVNGTTVTIEAGATLDIAGGINLYTADATIAAAEGLTVTTSVAGCEVKYADGKYTVVESIVLDDVIAATPAAEAIKEAMEAAGVTKIESYIITTGKADDDDDADADDVAAVLEVFDVELTVDANGNLSVAYEFGISNITNNGDGTVDITAGVDENTTIRGGVEVAFYADGVEITREVSTNGETVTITNIKAEDIKGKTISVKAEK